jgi:hypothetical protein
MTKGTGIQAPPVKTSGWLARWKARRTCDHDWVALGKDERNYVFGLELRKPFYVYRYRCSICGKRRAEEANN